MASRMLSVDFPPVAIMATFSSIARIFLTISAVRSAPETFRMSTPASIRPFTSSLGDTMVTVTGMSTFSFNLRIRELGVGLLSTIPSAPWNSAWIASARERSPLVIPPPTPQKIGLSAARMRACEITGWVNCYNGIGIGIPYNRHIGREKKRFKQLPEDPDAGAFLDTFGHQYNILPQFTAKGRDIFHRQRINPKIRQSRPGDPLNFKRPVRTSGLRPVKNGSLLAGNTRPLLRWLPFRGC